MLKIKYIIIVYIFIMLIFSQTELSLLSFFISLPLFIFLLLRNKKIKTYALKKTIFLSLIIAIGFIFGMVHFLEGLNYYFFFRDIYYFIQSLFFILMGIYLFSEIKNSLILLKILVVSSFIVTLYKFNELLTDPSLLLKVGLAVRYEYDLSNTTALVAFIIIYYARRVRLSLFNRYFELLIMWASFSSIAISFSRTIYVVTLLLLVLPYIRKSMIVTQMYFATFLLVLFVIFGNTFMDIETGKTQGITFEEKFLHSLDEITVKDYGDDAAAINNNWRGYEAFLGLSKYYTGNIGELFLGLGYGAYVESPYWLFQGKKLEYLPIFHNGYITILLKTGFVGLILFFAFLYILLQTANEVIRKPQNREIELLAMLLQAMVFLILFYTFVVHGIFQTTVPVLNLLLIGICLQTIGNNKIKLLNQKR